VTIVETSVWVDAFRGVSNAQTSWLDAQLTRGKIALTDLILFETLRGFGDPVQFRKAHDSMSRFVVFSTGGHELAVQSARDYQTLRRLGITVRSNIDCLIASYCIREGHALLHNDRDFDAFEQHLGLKVIHP
jgi:hypothetical protein